MAGKPGMGRTLPVTVPLDASPHDNLLALVDGRSLPVRAVNAAYAAIMSDLGGEQNVAYTVRSLALRGANIEVWISSVEARLLSGERADPDLLRSFLHASNVLHGLYRTIGLKRKPKDIPTLQEFLAQRAEETEQQPEPPDDE
jgi:hypothetical protein